MSLMEAPTEERVIRHRAPRTGGPWTDERIDLLKELWAKGLTAKQIGLQFGITRSAILGKAFRLGLDARIQRGPEAAILAKRLRARRPDSFHRKPLPKAGLPKPAPAPEISPFERPATACSLLELGAKQCHFPIGEPQDADFAFCGQPASDSHFGAYCAGHTAIAYRPRNGSA